MANEKALVKDAIGIFKGFTESGREFLAEVVTPYHPEFTPLLGSFILVTITDYQALLGRITQFYPMGTMVGTEADEYLSHLQRLNRPVPEDVKELKLRYNVKVRLLGMVELVGNQFRYRPGVRSLPHLGARVCLPSDEALQFVCNARLEDEPDAVPIGHYALGDRVFSNIEVKFSFGRLLSRRTFVFARAGYGKSNLIKLLVSKLYEQNPRVGMLIFDPEGEYSFRDALGRPGLADVPGIGERLVVFTDRRPPDAKYKPLIAGQVRLNLANVPATHVVDICLPEDRRDTVYATRLRGLKQQEWAECVNLLYQQGYQLRPQELKNFDLEEQQATAIIRNITPIVRRLHNQDSHLPQSVLYHLAQGHIVVVDISLLSSGAGQQIAGLILKTVFDHNVAHFTADDQDAVIPVVAVIEEAQNVLSAEKMKEDNPFVEWAKEGRKYNLGAILVTQQPGAISDQLLSQGDNFFALHLISSVDLDALKRNNAHFSDDILSYILNEPIEGNAYFWSAPSQPYVISAKVFSFEKYVEDKVKQMTAGAPQKIGLAVQTYQRLIEEVPQLIRDIIASDKRVPVYIPERDGKVLSGYGAVGQVNLRLRVAERFFEDHRELKPWMLPQYFEVLDDGKVALQPRWVLKLGKPVRGIKEGRSADYVLVELSQISFRGKVLDNKRVTITEKEEAKEQKTEDSQASPKGKAKRSQTTQLNLLGEE
jgi:hypothetical protein